MKKTYLFGMFAALALASCSSESEPAANNGATSEGEAQYLAVNICTPADSYTRAGETFEIGTTEENAVKKATFVLFKNGIASSSVDVSEKELTPWTENENNNNVARIAKAVLVLPNETEEEVTSASNDYKIVTIVNTTAPTVTIGTTKLVDYVKEASDYVQTATTGNGTFIMTTSVYKNGTDIINYTPVTSDNFSKSKELAEEKAVDIYVERVAAKATITRGSGFIDKNQNITLGKIDNEPNVPTQLQLKILGIEIANIADKSNLIKSLTNVTDPFPISNGVVSTTAWTNWNQASLFRSYWAQNPSGVGYKNQSWTDITDYSTPFYIQENAGGQTSKTAVLVKAQHVDQNGNGYSFVRIAGEMYTPQGGLKQLANMFKSANFFVKTTDKDNKNHYATLPIEAFAWATPNGTNRLPGVDEGWEAYLTFDQTKITEGKLVKYNPDSTAATEDEKYEETNAKAVNDALKTVAYRAWYWTDGKAYYFVNIKNEENVEGVVRNHVYKLALNDISGFGVPVFNPNEIIIPKEPKDGKAFYLAARINVLQWKIEAQNVNFKHEY